MKKLSLFLVTVASVLVAQTIPAYPKALRSSFVETYFDRSVPDPYRWMEDTQSSELKTWIQEQNMISNDYFASIPQRDEIKKRLLTLSNYEKYSLPNRVQNKYFYSYNSGLQPHAGMSLIRLKIRVPFSWTPIHSAAMAPFLWVG